MKIFKTPAMKESFSRTVTFFASFHLEPSRSTEVLIRLLYLSSCSSGGGRRLRHSSTTLSFAVAVDDFSFSRCRRTRSVCADNFSCHFSSRVGRARLSSRSKRVSVSGGVSQSSWPKSDVDAFRDRRLGLGIGEEPSGVLGSVGGEPPFADEPEDP